MTNEEQIESNEESFDLPIDTTAAKAKPRIHMAPGDSACISCEG